jgi:hypothetical protein
MGGNRYSMDYQVFYLPQKDRDVLCVQITHILLRRPEIVYAYVHGSFVAEDYFRDLDVAVWIDDKSWPGHTFAYEDGLAQEIVGETHIEFPIDVRILNKTSIPFQFKVFQGTLLVDRDPESRVQRIEYIVGRYLDLKPILMHALREVLAHET